MKKFVIKAFFFIVYIAHNPILFSSAPSTDRLASLAATLKTGTTNQSIQQVQLAVFIDDSETALNGSKRLGAVTSDFEHALLTTKNTDIPVALLTSESVLLNYVSRFNDPVMRSQVTEPFNFNDFYNIYSLRPLNLKLILLVPKSISNPFKTDKLVLYNPPKSSNLTTIYGHMERTIHFSEANFPQTDALFNATKLKAIFPALNPLVFWHIWMSGHGTDDEKQIVGIPTAQVQEVLNLFNTLIQTKTVYLNSCFLGGHQIRLLDFENAVQNRYLDRLTYMLIVNGVSPDWVLRSRSKFYLYNFFDEARKAQGFSKLMKILTATTQLGNPSIPQIWLPGGVGFQTFNLSDEILSIGVVKNLVALSSKTPIKNMRISEAGNKEVYQNVLLVYPENLQAGLEIYPLDGDFATEKRAFAPTGWKVAQLIKNKIVTEDPSIRNSTAEILKKLPANGALFQDGFVFDMLLEASSTNRLFPRIIPMTQTREYKDPNDPFAKKITQKFNTIVLTPRTDTSDLEFDNDINPFKGIMQFFTDAFIPFPSITAQTYHINSLTGLNDISLWLELMRALNTLNKGSGNAQISITTENDSLNSTKLNATAGQSITITNVQLSFYPYSDDTGSYVSSALIFDYAGTRYTFIFLATYKDGVIPIKYVLESASSSDVAAASSNGATDS